MTDLVQVALIAAIPPSLVALVTLVVGLYNKSQIKELRVTVNSRLSELVAQSKKASHAEGMEDEREVQRARVATKKPRVK